MVSSTHPVPWSIQVTDHSRGTAPLNYLWDFGDGTTSTAQSPMHKYTGAGPFLLCLTVSTPGSTPPCTSTVFCDTIRMDTNGIKYKADPEITLKIGDGSDGWTTTTTGINDVQSSLTYAVFPNPAKNQVVVAFTSENRGSTDVNIYNMNGQLVWNAQKPLKAGENSYKIDIDALDPGMYMLKLNTGEQAGMKLLVKE